MISAITLVEKMPRPTYLETLTSARMSCEEYHLSTYVSRNQELNAIEILIDRPSVGAVTLKLLAYC